jgi:hypothetical protein
MAGREVAVERVPAARAEAGFRRRGGAAHRAGR